MHDNTLNSICAQKIKLLYWQSLFVKVIWKNSKQIQRINIRINTKTKIYVATRSHL